MGRSAIEILEKCNIFNGLTFSCYCFFIIDKRHKPNQRDHSND